MDKLKMHSPNLTQGNIARIQDLFPGCVTEARGEDGSVKLAVNFDQLRQELAESIIEGPQERYQLNWPGKREALLEANAPISKTLRPAREESLDFDTTKNLFIEGDNLDCLKMVQEAYLGKVKLIYIDPPYNTGSDFIYTDNYAEDAKDYLVKSAQQDGGERKLVANVESNGRLHSNWLSMMYSRLKVAKNLLNEDGVVFISIDDNEVHNLRKLCDEIFGELSFVKQIHVQMSATQGMKVKAAKAGNIVKNGEHILVYSKNGLKDIGIKPLLDPAKYDNHYSLYLEQIDEGIYKESSLVDQVMKNSQLVDELISLKLMVKNSTSLNIQNCYQYSPMFKAWVDENANRIVRTHDTVDLPSEFTNKIDDSLVRVYETSGRSYLVAKANNGNFYQKIRLSEKIAVADDFNSTYGPTTIRGDWWPDFYLDMGNVNKEGDIEFKNGKKPVRLIKQIVKFTTNSDDLVMDFFAGSSTTAHAVMLANAEDGASRRFVMIQVPEMCDPKTESYKNGFTTIAEISKERIRRSGVQIKERLSDLLASRLPPLDCGFRVLRLDSSNMLDVYYTPDSLSTVSFDMFVDNIKTDRTPEDLLFQVMLDWGIDLSLPIATQAIQGKDVFLVDGNALAACFDGDGGIEEGFVKELAKLQPLRVVFRDAGFKDSSVKINVEQIFKLLSPSTEVKCI